MSPTQAIFLTAVGSFTLAAALSDLKWRRLPNWLNVAALVAALVAHTVFGGLSGLGFALLGFATGFGILFVLWLIGGGGGGDVKLMGALGAWLGAGLTLKVFLISAVLIAVMAVGIMALAFFANGFGYVKKRYMAVGKTKQQVPSSRNAPRKKPYRILPYAVPVALGTWLVLALAWQDACLPM